MTKKYNLYIIVLLGIMIFFNSCLSTRNYYKRNTFDYPKPVDTYNQEIKPQEKREYEFNGVYADNLFDGARMNNFELLNDSTYQVTIEPENFPINDSPWFAFRIKSDSARKINIKIDYLEGKHRYLPKISTIKGSYELIDTSKLIISDDKSYCLFPVNIDRNPIFISAQEIISSNKVKSWIEIVKQSPKVTGFKSIGKSNFGRDIPFFRIGKGSSKNKEVIVLLCRQHPPEVTGYFGLQSFVEELCYDTKLENDFLERYDVWVFPLINPDGVDLGHWRHNANGIDINRDWAFYRQKEIDVVTKYIVHLAKTNKNKVILGLDFHSTQKDMYYVFDDSFDSTLKEFKEYWTNGIDRLVYPFKTEYSPSPMTKPYSKVWFYKQFKAQSITYEVGDETDRHIIDKKARAAAIIMMSLLVNRDD